MIKEIDHCPCCLVSDPKFTRTDDLETYRCSVCGLPFWVNEEQQITTPAVSPKWVAIAGLYWKERHMIVFPCDYEILDVTYKGVVLRSYTEFEVLEWNKHIDRWL